MQLSYKEFKTNPLLYFLFLPLLATCYLFYILNSNHESSIKSKDEDIKELKERNKTLDSINHNLYYLLGVKNTIDTLK